MPPVHRPGFFLLQTEDSTSSHGEREPGGQQKQVVPSRNKLRLHVVSKAPEEICGPGLRPKSLEGKCGQSQDLCWAPALWSEQLNPHQHPHRTVLQHLL